MTNAFRSSIQQMAMEFASSVVLAIRGASLDDILSETGSGSGRGHAARPAAGTRSRPSGNGSPSAEAATAPRRGRSRKTRLGRRSSKDIAAVVSRIVALLEAKPKGLRAEQIRAELGLQANELPRPIADALKGRRISKIGQKRATTYFAGGARSRAAKPATGATSRKTKKPTRAGKPARRKPARKGARGGRGKGLRNAGATSAASEASAEG